MSITDNQEYLKWLEYLKYCPRNAWDFDKLNVRSINETMYELQLCHRAINLEDIKGKKLFIMGEDGYGDFIWFYRYMPLLKEICEVTLFCPKPVEPLFRSINTVTEFPERMSMKFDCYIWMFDLLNLMDTFGTTGKYIEVPEKRLLPAKERFRIGFALGNYGGLEQMSYRNISHEIIKYLIKEKVEAYNFSNIGNAYCVNLFDKFDNFQTTAQYVEEMDLMITSDNCILHLAGALSKKTIAIFTERHEPMWFGLPDNVLWYDSVDFVITNTSEKLEQLSQRIKDKL